MKNLSKEVQDKLTNDILDIIGKTENGESASYLMKELRGKGWKNLGRTIYDLADLCEELGFTVRTVQEKNASMFRRGTFITL